jgi:hypothetical protein
VVPEGLVFWNQKRPHCTLSAKGIQKKMERYAKAAGLKASCHRLRQTFASNRLETGAEIISITELMGHASVKSSERYAKLSNQRVKQVYQQTIRKGKRNKKGSVHSCPEPRCVQDVNRGEVAPWATCGSREGRAEQDVAHCGGGVDGHGR